MSRYEITVIGSGAEMGTYEGETAREAVTAMAIDGGDEHHFDGVAIYTSMGSRPTDGLLVIEVAS